MLVCAGWGSDVEAMRRRAAEIGQADHLRLVGSLELEELATLLASSDLVVAPHMGYTLIEAGLTGTPIATYDYDFHAEIIRDGETGYLAPLRDTRALANKVIRALADPQTSRAVGARLRDALLREHSLDAVVPLYQEAYDLVLGVQSA
jgi:glycosyltransferase involved in cell wall biosynthesis